MTYYDYMINNDQPIIGQWLTHPITTVLTYQPMTEPQHGSASAQQCLGRLVDAMDVSEGCGLSAQGNVTIKGKFPKGDR